MALMEGLSNRGTITTVLANQQKSFLQDIQSHGRGLRTPEETRKILMPMIRKILPGTIAQNIVGVQPMQGIGGSIYTMRPSQPRNITFEKTKVDMHWCCEFMPGINVTSTIAIEEWLKQFPKTNYWTQQDNPWGTYYVNIYDEEMLTAFILRWQNSAPM